MELENVLLNSNVVDGLSTIGYAKKVAGMYWTRASNIVKENSFWISKDVVYNAVRNKVSGNISQVNLQSEFDVAYQVSEEQIALCDNNKIFSTEPAVTSLDYRAIEMCSPCSRTKGTSEPTKSSLVAFMAVPKSDVAIVTTGSLSLSETREWTQLHDDNIDVQSNPPDHVIAEIVDPARLLLLQRRLDIVSNLAANDMTEAICIYQANLIVRDGYRQLSKSILDAKRQVEDLSSAARFDPRPNDTSITNDIDTSSHDTIFLPNESGNEDVLLYDILAPQIVGTDSCMNPIQGSFYEDVDDSLLEEKNVCKNYDTSLIDRKKHAVQSPCNTLYTYRSDDSLENDPLDAHASSDVCNTMPFIFTSLPQKRGAKNEEIRSLLSQNILLNRRRVYAYRRPKRKSVFSRLVCIR